MNNVGPANSTKTRSVFVSAMFKDGRKVRPLRVTGMGGRSLFPHDRDCEDHVYCNYEFPAPGYDARDSSTHDNKIVVTYSSINGNDFGGYGEVVMGKRGTMILEKEKDVLLFGNASNYTKVKVTKKGGDDLVLDTTQSPAGDAQIGEKALNTGIVVHARDAASMVGEVLEEDLVQADSPPEFLRAHRSVDLKAVMDATEQVFTVQAHVEASANVIRSPSRAPLEADSDIVEDLPVIVDESATHRVVGRHVGRCAQELQIGTGHDEPNPVTVTEPRQAIVHPVQGARGSTAGRKRRSDAAFVLRLDVELHDRPGRLARAAY